MAAVARLVPGKTALFVCDMQERFRSAIFHFDMIAKMSAKMVKAATIFGDMPCFVTEQNPRALGTTVPELKMDELPAKLHPLGRAVDKTRFSMLVPEVRDAFHKEDIQSVLIVGIESHVCVLQTTLDLLKQGVHVWVLADAVSSCNAEEIPIALARLRQAGAHISTTESALFELMGDAKHERFKAISGLIKDTKAETREALQALRRPSLDGHI